MVMPIRPEIRNRIAKAVIGGASATIIRAEVKADDHISAKASPMKIDRKSILTPPPAIRLSVHCASGRCKAFGPGYLHMGASWAAKHIIHSDGHQSDRCQPR
jgi:hypothetical protein